MESPSSMTIDSTAAEPTTKLTRKRYRYPPLSREKQDAKNKKQREFNQKNPLTQEQRDDKNKKLRETRARAWSSSTGLAPRKQGVQAGTKRGPYKKKNKEKNRKQRKTRARTKKAMSPSTGPSSIEAVAAAEVQAQAQAEAVAAAEVQAKSEAAAAVEGKAQAEAVAAQERRRATVRARQVEEEEEEEREIRRGQKSDAAKATAAAAAAYPLQPHYRFSVQQQMSATATTTTTTDKTTSTSKLARKREMARLRQQKCRARKRQRGDADVSGESATTTAPRTTSTIKKKDATKKKTTTIKKKDATKKKSTSKTLNIDSAVTTAAPIPAMVLPKISSRVPEVPPRMAALAAATPDDDGPPRRTLNPITVQISKRPSLVTPVMPRVSDAAKATAAAAVTDDEEKESESEEDAANKATEKAAKKAASKIKTIELNSILSAANSSILRNGLYNGDKFYFHAGVNNNDNGATAGEAPSFNFRTEDNVIYTFSRWSRAFTAMNHEIRGAAPSSSLKHGAGRDTKLLNGLGQHSSDDCCVLVFSVIGKTTAAAVQFLEETTVNKGKLKVEFQNVIDTVKQYWPRFDEIILPWFTTTKHYVAVGLCRDQQNGNGYIRLSIPTSCNSNGHFSTILEENSLTMNQISCTVYSPILCRMIKHASHTGHTRIQFYSKIGGFMPLHQDSAGERAHEYIKCSYMETGVGLTYSK